MLTRVIATAPGKLIIAGEYAVLDGATAVVVAVDRRAIARRVPGASPSSPFLSAVADELARRGAAAAAREIVVDSTAFYDGARKLGLGSSAAVTVAAAHLATGGACDRAELFAITAAAHARAQGVRGSGADLAAAIWGGVLAFAPGPPPRHHPTIQPLAWPAGVRLLAFFTGHSADTAALVQQVSAARAGAPVAINAALTAIAGSAEDLRDALATADPSAALAALDSGSEAMDELAAATRLPLVPPCVNAARSAMRRLGGTARTTGAGGGDIGVAVLPTIADVTTATRALIEVGCQPLALSVEPYGVDTRAGAQ
jgi:phosphomevalonate kinase